MYKFKTNKGILFFFIALLFIPGKIFASINTGQTLTLKKGNFQIVVADKEAAPVKLAVQTLCDDFAKVIQWQPQVSNTLDQKSSVIQIVVINKETASTLSKNKRLKSLDGFESHRVYTDPSKKCIYLLGEDMRGTIYAIYTFSEQILGVPPLHYFCSWVPEYKSSIEVPAELDFYQKSPQVRYRAWFPNDTDLFTPWRKLSKQNNELWLETMLRLKLNTVELEATVTYPDYKLNDQAELLRKYGLILTSHHHIALNNCFRNWDGYWRNVRGVEPPEFSLKQEQNLIDFWTYSVETVAHSNMENLWQITFRGAGDQPFWALFQDAPETDKERAEIINKMLRIQLNLIKKVTGDKDPYVRMTFYDELSDLLAMGYLNPPAGKNMLWTYVAARRDHYPNDDLVAFDTKRRVKLGYYMNLQFTSTGAHLAPAEGPWKMEANYRYVNNRAPLYFSVVNAGNIREFVLSMSANAKMMWDMNSYNTDIFLEEFCEKYFGKQHASEVAKLYHDYFYAYWQQKPSDFPGIDRQYLFHDLRYSRAFDQIAGRFHDFTPNPLKDIGFERMPGRTFRLEKKNEVDSILVGMQKAAPRFEAVRKRCEKTMNLLDKDKQTFFRDNLYAPCKYMENLSKSMYHFVLAYKTQQNNETCEKNMRLAISYLEEARDALYSTQEGVFSQWYAGDTANGKFNIPYKLKNMHTILDSITSADK